MSMSCIICYDNSLFLIYDRIGYSPYTSPEHKEAPKGTGNNPDEISGACRIISTLYE